MKEKQWWSNYLGNREHPAEQKSGENVVVIRIITQPHLDLNVSRIQIKKGRERKRKEKRERWWNWKRDLDEIVFGGSVAGRESGGGKGRPLLIVDVFATRRWTHNHFLFFLLLHRYTLQRSISTFRFQSNQLFLLYSLTLSQSNQNIKLN